MSNFYFDIPLDKVELVAAQNLKINIPESIAHRDVLYTISRATSAQLERLKVFAGDDSPAVSVGFKIPSSTSTELEVYSLHIDTPELETKFRELGVGLEKQLGRDDENLTVEQTARILGALPAVARSR